MKLADELAMCSFPGAGVATLRNYLYSVGTEDAASHQTSEPNTLRVHICTRKKNRGGGY